jgi:hypothetical protein
LYWRLLYTQLLQLLHTTAESLCCCCKRCHALVEVLVLVRERIQVQLHARVALEALCYYLHLFLQPPERLHPNLSPKLCSTDGRDPLRAL